MRPASFATADDIVLEGRWDGPDHPERVAVLCHPHPQHGGTMTAPLLRQLTKHLTGAGFAVLRFNFRGVGASGGEWGDGTAEIDDVAAAVPEAAAAHPGLPLGLAGWSFGAVTALRWIARHGSTLPYVGIAPVVSSPLTPPLPDALPPARRTFILGDRDQFTTVEALESYAAGVGGEVVVLEGSDHFFYFREQRLAEAVIAGLS